MNLMSIHDKIAYLHRQAQYVRRLLVTKDRMIFYECVRCSIAQPLCVPI